MSIITEIIIWTSPIIAGGFLWLFIDAYQEVKGDVKDLKNSNANIRTDIAKQGVQITSLDTKVSGVCKTVETVRAAVHEIDKRTSGVTELNGTVKNLTARVDESDRKYGQILMILNGMAKRIGIDIKKSGT